MIVKLKKVSLVVLDSEIEESMTKLRDAGIMHLNLTDTGSGKIEELQEKKILLEKSLAALPETDETGKTFSKDSDYALEVAGKVHDLNHRHFLCQEEILHLEREIYKVSPWGHFNIDDIKYLEEKNVHIRLYELNIDQYNALPEGIKTFIISRTKTLVRLAAIFINEDKAGLPYEEVPFPDISLEKLEQKLKKKKLEIESIQNELKAYSDNLSLLKWALEEVDKLLEFEYAVSSMNNEGKVAYITGYIPHNETNDLKRIASKNGWGLMITDPSEEDIVPSLVKNPKWINAISPVFKLLGTIPGYKEYDISMWFLIFFSIFWAMIIGDAGYGMIFLILTIIGRIKFKKASFEPFLLLFITSITTIIWGAITGNWFGAKAFAEIKALSWMIIPSIASFSAKGNNADSIIMNMCFLIGAIHLSVAHLMNFFRFFPSLKAYSEIGRISLVWAVFLLIRDLVLKIDMPPFFLWLLCGGLALIIIFSEQNGNFIKGIKDSLSNLIFIALNSISFFSDVVSYVRLFAVGLASLEVAKSFNGMAMSLGSGVFAVIGSALILFFAHSLNITLCTMSLIVHGIRLNMLEFSGHLNMEWSGFVFKPFKKR